MTETLPVVRPVELDVFEIDQRRAKAYAESGYWPDAASVAKALVKIEAGRSLGLTPMVAMNEVHVIDGKPSLGAGAVAALVKSSGRYDYRILELTAERCVIRFFDRGTALNPDSTFTIEDAKAANLTGRTNWRQYPRNMLFARAMTNGAGWHCPDIFGGRVYDPDELGQPAVAALPDDVPPAADHAEWSPVDEQIDENYEDDDIPFGEPAEEKADE